MKLNTHIAVCYTNNCFEWLDHTSLIPTRKIIDVNDIKDISHPMLSDHINVKQPKALKMYRVNITKRNTNKKYYTTAAT